MREAVTVLLRESHRLRRGDRAWLAELIAASSRTLWSWERQDASLAGPGRPTHSQQERRRVLRTVARQWRREGWSAGWRVLADRLPAIPTRLVQTSLAALKARRRRREERRRTALRQHVEVLARDVLWSQDGTHLGRWLGKGVNAEVVREVATCKTLDLWVLPRATKSEDVIALLEGLWRQGRLPLVWSTDNGSCYCSAEVEAWLAEHWVIHLRSLPHTPQHNAWVERDHGELKAESGLGKGVVLSSLEEAAQRVLKAREILDEYRLRARLGARTAAEIDRSLPSWEGVLDRRAFHDAVCRAREHAVLDTVGARARRLAERDATWAVLESYGLVRRTRGGAPLPSREAEGIS